MREYHAHNHITLQCVAVCCSVLQCVAVCCSVLCCSVLQCVAVCCSVLLCVIIVRQYHAHAHKHTATRSKALQHAAARIPAPSRLNPNKTDAYLEITPHTRTATHRNTLQHTAANKILNRVAESPPIQLHVFR